MPCLSCEMCSFNGALLPFFFFLFLDNGNRATVFAGVQFIAETAYDQCCMLPTEPGYFTRAVLSQLYFF